jgi:hypothetical protein
MPSPFAGSWNAKYKGSQSELVGTGVLEFGRKINILLVGGGIGV